MVGDILRRERERQKLSVKDIEHGTSIRALYIEAIENGEYDKLPVTVYAKGFIKNYGNFLKLEGEALSRQFAAEISPTSQPVASDTTTSARTSTPNPTQLPLQTQNSIPRTESSVSTSTSSSSISRPENTSTIANEARFTNESTSANGSNVIDEAAIGNGKATINEAARVAAEPIPNIDNQIRLDTELKNSSARLVNEKSSSSGLLMAAVVLIAAIVGGLWYYFTNIEGKELSQNPTVHTQTQEDIDKNPENSNSTSVSAHDPSAKAAPIDGLALQAKFNDRCWTRVVVDGRVAYEGTAEPGQTLSWQAKDRIVITAGNAGAVELIENGSNIGKAGAVGDVVERTFVRK